LSSNSTNVNDNVNHDHDREEGMEEEGEGEESGGKVNKLLTSKWENVNGTYDSETDWREWDEMTNAVSYNGDLLHILPYVNINW